MLNECFNHVFFLSCFPSVLIDFVVFKIIQQDMQNLIEFIQGFVIVIFVFITIASKNFIWIIDFCPFVFVSGICLKLHVLLHMQRCLHYLFQKIVYLPFQTNPQLSLERTCLQIQLLEDYPSLSRKIHPCSSDLLFPTSNLSGYLTKDR